MPAPTERHPMAEYRIDGPAAPQAPLSAMCGHLRRRDPGAVSTHVHPAVENVMPLLRMA